MKSCQAPHVAAAPTQMGSKSLYITSQQSHLDCHYGQEGDKAYSASGLVKLMTQVILNGRHK